MFCAARVTQSKACIRNVNTPITGLSFCSDPQSIQRALSLFDFLSRINDLFLSQAKPWGAAISGTKAEMAEGVKREPTDPHKQALSFMASVTPSLLKPDSETFKHYWRAPPPPTPSPLSHSFSYTIHSLQRISLFYPPRHSHPITPWTWTHSTHNTSAYTLYTHTPGKRERRSP